MKPTRRDVLKATFAAMLGIAVKIGTEEADRIIEENERITDVQGMFSPDGLAWIMLSSDGKIACTINGGETWRQFPPIPSHNRPSFAMRPPGEIVALCGYASFSIDMTKDDPISWKVDQLAKFVTGRIQSQDYVLLSTDFGYSFHRFRRWWHLPVRAICWLDDRHAWLFYQYGEIVLQEAEPTDLSGELT